MNDYIKCPNSNLLFYGTKLDRNGNDCAVFGTPNGRKFLIQRNSLWGTESWNTGSKSTMDAETFLSKNPNVTLERLEKDVIRAANESNASWGKNIRVHNKQILDSKIKDDDSSKGLIEDFSSWASAERCPLTPYHFKGFKENDPSFNSNAAFDIIDELVKWNGFILEDLNDLVVAKFDKHDNATVEECCEDIKFRVGNALSRVDRYFNGNNYIVQLYIKALERAHRLAVNELKSLNTVSDSRKIKDENTPDVLDGVLFIAFTDGTEDDMIAEVNKHANESDTIDGVQYETYETDSSDGVAMIDMCAATGDANAFVKALLNKWGIAENVADLEFEASDEMKEAVNDSRKQVRDNKDYLFNNHKTFNPPVSVALNSNSTWEVEQIHLNDVKNDYITGGIIVTENVYQPSSKKLVSRRRTRCEFELDLTNNTITFGFYVPDKAKQTIVDLILENFGDYTISDSRKQVRDNVDNDYEPPFAVYEDGMFAERFDTEKEAVEYAKHLDFKYEHETEIFVVDESGGVVDDIVWSSEWVSDSRVNDMTKPVHLRGYAEKMRAKRRNKNADDEPNTDEEKPNVSDSRIRDGFATRYDVAYNEDPYKLAQRIAKNGTISTRSRHQCPHDVNVNKNTIFHVYNDRDYSYDDFMNKYGVNDSRRMSGLRRSIIK